MGYIADNPFQNYFGADSSVFKPQKRSLRAEAGDTGPGGGTFAWVQKTGTDRYTLKNYYRSLSSCGKSPSGTDMGYTCWPETDSRYVAPDDNPFTDLWMLKFDWKNDNKVKLRNNVAKSSGAFKAVVKDGWRVELYVETKNANWFGDQCQHWSNPNWVDTNGKFTGNSDVTFILDGSKGDYFSLDVDDDWDSMKATALKINGQKVCDTNWNSSLSAIVKLLKVYHLEETDLPVNCEVSAWSDWGDCINGGQARTRSVIIPAANGGTACETLNNTRNCTLTEGCTDPTATNYNSNANKSDNSCRFPLTGCMDVNANNYDSTAEQDNGTCTYTCDCPDNRKIKSNGECAECNTGYEEKDGCCVEAEDDETTSKEASKLLPVAGIAAFALIAILVIKK